MKLLRAMLVAAALSAASCATEAPEAEPVDGLLPDTALPEDDAARAEDDAPDVIEVVADAGVADALDVAVTRDAPSTMDAPAPRDVAPPRDVPREAATRMDAGVDAPRVLDAGPPRVDARADAPRPMDAGPPPVPRPSDVRPGASCHALIRSLGVRFTVGPATRGIVDPVTVTTPIEGVHYRYASWTASDRPLVMDCRLAVALVRMSRALRDRWNITDVQHIGVYNYRTIAGSTRLSQHAYAMAIDIGALRAANGTTYSVLNDFVMNGAPTCPPRATNARDRVLKEFACSLYDARTFNIVLTPNYNSAHRNHYHVDLTAGSHFVQLALPSGVDPPHDPFLDMLLDDE